MFSMGKKTKTNNRQYKKKHARKKEKWEISRKRKRARNGRTQKSNNKNEINQIESPATHTYLETLYRRTFRRIHKTTMTERNPYYITYDRW